MERQITLSDKQIKELVSFYENKQNALRDKMIELNNEMREIENLLKPLKESSISEAPSVSERKSAELFNNEEQSSNSYNPDWSTAKKAEWVIENENKSLPINEIVSKIGNQEPYLFKGNKDQERNYKTSLSATLGTKARKGKVFYRTKNEEDIFEYGLTKWKN